MSTNLLWEWLLNAWIVGEIVIAFAIRHLSHQHATLLAAGVEDGDQILRFRIHCGCPWDLGCG